MPKILVQMYILQIAMLEYPDLELDRLDNDSVAPQNPKTETLPPRLRHPHPQFSQRLRVHLQTLGPASERNFSSISGLTMWANGVLSNVSLGTQVAQRAPCQRNSSSKARISKHGLIDP